MSFRALVERLRKRIDSPRTGRKLARRSLQLQRLEDRVAPAVSLLNHFDSPWSGAQPPDTCGAAGPYSYIESGNSWVQIYNKSTGAGIASDGFYHFLHTVGGLNPEGVYDDATMLYDEPIGRFIVAEMDDGGDGHSALDIAVSKTNNPTALDANNWYFYLLDVSEAHESCDYPGNPGYNADGFYWTYNMYKDASGGSYHTEIAAIPNSSIASGSGFTYYTYDQPGFNYRPVTIHDGSSGGPMWFVQDQASVNFSNGSNSINLVRMDNPISAGAASFHSFNIGVNSYSEPNDPLNPNGTGIVPGFNGLDAKIQKAAERYNHIVASQSIGVNSNEDDSRWYEFNISNINSPYLEQQGQVGYGANTYAVYAAIDINYNGDIGMGFSKVGNDTSTDYMSTYITGHKTGIDGSGVMETPVLIKAGDSNNTDGRMGDFSGINIDPNDGTFWVNDEYTTSNVSHQEIANFAMNQQSFYLVGGQLQIYGDQLGSNTADTITVDVNARGGVYATLNGEPAGFDAGQVTSIYINPEGGTNYVYIYNVPSNCGTYVDGGDGVDNVYVGNGTNGVQGINSFVFVYNGFPSPSSSGWSTLTINDTADTLGRNATQVETTYNSGSYIYNQGYITGLAPATIEWFDNSAGTYTGGVEYLEVDGGSGGNTFNIAQDGNLWSGTYYIGHAPFFGPHDAVNIGSGGNAQGIVGYLGLSNPPGYDDITIDDSADSTARTTTITSGSISGLTPGYITYASSDTSSLTVKTGGSGGNTVYVQSTSVDTSVVGNAPLFGPDDTIIVGSSGSVQSILGTLGLSNPPGYDLITLDDSADSSPRTVTMNSGSVTGLAPATINYATTDFHSLTVNTGSSGGNTVNIQTSTGNTNVVGNAPFLGPDDTINIGNAGSVQGIFGTLSLSNPPGYDVITVDDSADTSPRTVTMTAGSITGLAPGTINYATTDFHGLTVYTSGSGGNTVNIQTATGNTNVVGNAPFLGPDDTINIGNAGSVQGIFGTLSLSNPPGYDLITVDDSADATPTTTTITNGSVTGLAPGTINYVWADTASLTVNTGTASGNVVDVQSTGPTTNVVGNNYETVYVSNGGSVQSIFGSLYVSNASSSYTYLTVDDSADPTGLTVAMNDGSVAGLAPASVNWVPTATFSGGVAYVHVLGGSGGNTFNINNTSNFGGGYTWVETGSGNDTANVLGSQSALYVYSGAGNDTMNVRATGTGSANYIYNDTGTDTVTIGSLAPALGGKLTGINGSVEVYGGGSSVLTVDASGETVGRAATLAGGVLTGLGNAGSIYYVPGEVTTLTINGPKAGSTFNVQSTPAGTPVTINGGVGADIFNVGSTTSSTSVLTGIAANVSIVGNGGTDTINARDGGQSTGQSYTFSAGALTGSDFSGTITYAVENLRLSLGNGNNSVIAMVLPAGVTVIGGTGNNTLTGPSLTNTWTINGANAGFLSAATKLAFSNIQNLVGGGGNDTFKFVGLSPSLAGTLNGGGGSDKLDYSGYTGGAISVTLSSATSGTASLIGGGFSNIESLNGSGNAGDTLTGINATTAWAITALNGGKAGTFSFTNIKNLVGGSGADTFKISNGKGVSGSITGGGGADVLDYSAWTTAVTVNLQSGIATGVGGTVSGFHILNGGSGNDSLTGTTGNDIIRGNAGDDVINGNGGSDILIGGAGNDTISVPLSSGRSILIGSQGNDSLTGGTAGCILIGGYTSYDSFSSANDTKLNNILNEWLSSTDNYATRIAKIRAGVGTAKFSSTTVHDDTNTDVLTGQVNFGSGNGDWFWAGVSTNPDSTNAEAGEQIN